MQWWRSPQWRSLVEHAEDPSSARLALAAAAHEINFIGNPMDREQLAKACEAPDVVLAFHSVGDDQSYPLWASDSLDAWEDNTRALVAAGVPEPVAARRAALVFGTTESNRDYIKAASNHTISDADLMMCADSTLVSELAQYTVDPVDKAEKLWDESSVNRDTLGQFAEKDRLSEKEETGHSFRVVGGRKYKIKEKQQERVKVKEERPERVERKTSDKELLSHQARFAEARKQKAEEKAKKLQKVQRLSRLNAVAQQAEKQRQLEAARVRHAEQEKAKEALRATPKGRAKEAVERRQRSRAKLRMGRKERLPTEYDPGSKPPVPDVGALAEQAIRDADNLTLSLGLDHEPVMVRSHETKATLQTDHTGGFPFHNPGVNLVTDSRGSPASVADIGVYLERILETAQKNVDQIGEDVIGARVPLYPDEVVADMATYAEALYGQAMRNMAKQLAGRPDAKAQPWSDAHFALHADTSDSSEPELLLVPMSMLDVNADPPPIDVGSDGKVQINLKTLGNNVYRRRLHSHNAFVTENNAEYVLDYDKRGMMYSSFNIKKDWDESEVKRDKLGQFAPEGKQAFAVVNGRKVKVQVKERVAEHEQKVKTASPPSARSGAERRIRLARLKALEENRTRSLASRPPERAVQALQAAPGQAQPEQVERRVRSRSKLRMDDKEAKREAVEVAAKVQVQTKPQERVSLSELSQHKPKVQNLEQVREQNQEQVRVRTGESTRTRVQAQEKKQVKTPEKPRFPKKPFVLPSGVSGLTQAMIERPNVPGGYRRLIVNSRSGLSETSNVEESLGGAEEPGSHGNDPYYDRIVLSEGRDYYDPNSLAALKEIEDKLDQGGSHEIEVAGSGTYDDAYVVEYVGPAKRQVAGSIAVIKAAPKRLMLKRR